MKEAILITDHVISSESGYVGECQITIGVKLQC